MGDVSSLTVYHGHASPTKLAKCRDAAPEMTHGVEWSDPRRMPERDEPYILDNGAYSAAIQDEQWDRRRWYRLLIDAHDQPRDPDWVVLPDVFGNGARTRLRHERYVEVVRSHGFDYYAVVQKGRPVADQVLFAESLDASGVFLGGPMEWKRKVADEVRAESDRRGLKMHIGQPGDLSWALDVGVDSVDTTSIVVHDAYEKLTQAQEQQTLAATRGVTPHERASTPANHAVDTPRRDDSTRRPLPRRECRRVGGVRAHPRRSLSTRDRGRRVRSDDRRCSRHPRRRRPDPGGRRR